MEAARLGQRDHPLGDPPEFLRLGIGGLDLLVLQERGHHVAKHGRAMARGPAEFSSPYPVSHEQHPFRSLVSLRAGGLIPALGRPVDLHAEREPHLGEDLLDLVEGLPAEVAGLEHLRFRLLDELADDVDAGVLEAVGRPHGELQLVHALEEVLAELLALAGLLLHLLLFRLLEVDEDVELVFQDLGRVGDGVLGQHAAVGPDLEDKLVEVGDLPHAGVAHRVAHPLDGREDGVDVDGALGLIGVALALGHDVALAHLHDHLGLHLAARREGGDGVIGVEDLHVGVGDDVAGPDGTRLRGVDLDRPGHIAVELQADALEIQDDVRHVLLHARDGGELVEDLVEAHGHDGRPLDRGEQHAPQGVAQRDAVAPLERLDGEFRVGLAVGLLVDLDPFRPDQAAPVSLHILFPSRNQARTPPGKGVIARYRCCPVTWSTARPPAAPGRAW